MTLWGLFTILTILQVADFYTTKRILDRGGYEKAGIMIWLMNKIGPLKAMVITKGLLCVLVAVLIVYLNHDVILMVLMLAGIIVYTYVVIGNWKVYKEQKNEC